jgi:hypothetical protein
MTLKHQAVELFRAMVCNDCNAGMLPIKSGNEVIVLFCEPQSDDPILLIDDFRQTTPTQNNRKSLEKHSTFPLRSQATTADISWFFGGGWHRQTLSLTSFPDELLLCIFSHLNTPYELCRLACVCKRWKNISEDTVLWRPLFVKQWGLVHDADEIRTTKQEFFRRKKEILKNAKQISAKSYSRKRTFSQMSTTWISVLCSDPNQNPLHIIPLNDGAHKHTFYGTLLNGDSSCSSHRQSHSKNNNIRRFKRQKKEEEVLKQRLEMQKQYFNRIDREVQLVVVPSSPSYKVG